MAPDEAKDLYKLIHQIAKKKYNSQKIQDGEFGAMMAVDLTNDGPVTITLDFDKPEQKKADPNSKKSKKRESSTPMLETEQEDSTGWKPLYTFS